MPPKATAPISQELSQMETMLSHKIPGYRRSGRRTAAMPAITVIKAVSSSTRYHWCHWKMYFST